jgi:hypothetical protein
MTDLAKKYRDLRVAGNPGGIHNSAFSISFLSKEPRRGDRRADLRKTQCEIGNASLSNSRGISPQHTRYVAVGSHLQSLASIVPKRCFAMVDGGFGFMFSDLAMMPLVRSNHHPISHKADSKEQITPQRA